MKFDTLDAQMRLYEECLDQTLPPGIWTVIRVDGRSFTKLTNRLKLEKPFDVRLRDGMLETTKRLMECGFQARYGYLESDEISILISRFDNTFNRKIRKWVSIFAAEASATLTHILQIPVAFDARICVLPDTTAVIDYFRWRQSDSQRNSINGYCYWKLRQDGVGTTEATNMLEGMSLEEKIALLFRFGINHKEIPLWQRNGIGIYWQTVDREGYNPIKQQKVVTSRRVLSPVLDLPIGNDYDGLLRKLTE